MTSKDCAAIQAQIAEASREQLRNGISQSVDAHVNSCAECREYLDQTLGLDSVLSNSVVSAPPELYSAVVNNLSSPKVRVPRRLAVLLCLLALLLLTFAWVYKNYYVVNEPNDDGIINTGAHSRPSQPGQEQSKASRLIHPHN